jgi:hypothetical protein
MSFKLNVEKQMEVRFMDIEEHSAFLKIYNGAVCHSPILFKKTSPEEGRFNAIGFYEDDGDGPEVGFVTFKNGDKVVPVEVEITAK